MPDRKIKIFPKSIVRIELHVKFNRLFVQCTNDPLIYVIETTSAVVIQTIKYSDHDHNAFMEIRSTFTVSPCGSLLFVKSPNDDQLKCIRLSNEEQIAEIRIPISLTTCKYSITSLAYHPNKNLLVCSIFGDLINASLFFICNETDTEQHTHPPGDVNEFYAFQALDEWQKNHEQEFIQATDDGIKSIAIDSILNRIDDLFFMAIQNPKHNDNDESGGAGSGGGGGSGGHDQFKEVHEFLEKIRIDPSQSRAEERENYDDDSEYHVNSYSNEPSSQSGYHMMPVTKLNLRSDDESQSDVSRHTFDVEQSATKQKQNETIVAPKIDENEQSNATFSIQSESTSNHSNLTFEIPKM